MKTVVFALACCLLLAVALNPGNASAQASSASAASADEVADERLRKVMTAVAGQPLTAAPFVERRTSVLFASPLESRGTLSFKPSGVIEKLTTSPQRESMTLTAETITLDAGNGAAPQVIKMETQGPLTPYVQGLRAVLSGDEKLLRQVFDTRMTGSFDAWKIHLKPKGPAPRRGIKQIVIGGTGGKLHTIETTEINGDVQEMTITVR